MFPPHRAGPGNNGSKPGWHACINARVASSGIGSINPISGVCLERGLGMLVGLPFSSGGHPRQGYSVDGGFECYVGDQANTLTSDRVSISHGLPTVPKSLLERLQRREFIDLAKLMPPPSIHDLMIDTQARFALSPLQSG